MTTLTQPRVIHLAETASTNTAAMDRANAGESLPFWLIADRQTAGRGRSGRAWIAGDGNFQASLAVGLSCGPAQAAQLSLVAGWALAQAIGDLVGNLSSASSSIPPIELKWPNDLLIGRAKCAGILIETARRTDGVLIAVIGFGINLVSHPNMNDRALTHLSAHGLDIAPKSMLSSLRTTMDTALATWDEGAGFTAVRENWSHWAFPLGSRMSVHAGEQRILGEFAGLDTDGALLLADPTGHLTRYTYGDVTLSGDAGALNNQLRGST